MVIYTIADLHLQHFNIIGYCSRPFSTVEEMNKVLINNWNNIVKDNDIIYFLGDMALGEKEVIKSLVKRLNGKIYMVKGNHDKHFSTKFWLECGIKETLPQGYKLIIGEGINKRKYILSHQPLEDKEIPKGYINLHGHIHNTVLNDKFNPNIHRCVSVEMIGYKPVLLE